MTIRYFPIFFTILTLGSCTASHTGSGQAMLAVPVEQSAPQVLDNEASVSAARISGPAGGNIASPSPSASYSVPAPITDSPPATELSQGDISLDFADTDIRTAVDQILGSILHLSYTIDPNVQGTVTLHTATPLSRAALIPTLQTLLAQDKAVLVQTNGIYRVIPSDQAVNSPAQAGDPALGGSAIVPLRYASAAQLAAILQPYVEGGGKIIADPEQNVLIIGGDPATRQALINLVQAFDVDELAGQSYELFPVVSGSVSDFATAFSAALAKSTNDAKASSAVTVVPLQRINAVLVIARAQSYLSNAARIYAVINQVQRETVRSWHVYYVQNDRANDAAYVLQQAFTPDNVTAQPSAQTSSKSANLASQAMSSMNAGSGGGITDQSGSGTGGGGGLPGSSMSTDMSATPTDSTDTSSSNPTSPSMAQNSTDGASALLGPLSSGTSGGSATGIRILVDAENNSLLIYATPQEDDEINGLLSKIDILPLEVRIDATIAEVDLNSQLEYGTQFFFKSGGINAVLSNAATSSLETSFPGFVLSGSGSDAAPLAISALQAVTKVRVLSSPELMVLDGQAASLVVGDLVPYLSQTSQNTESAGAPVINSINYQETGVILQVTPHIGSDGLVTLDVAQQVSGVAPTITTSGLNSPTFTQRAVTSRVAIQDGQTVGLAGLISDSDSHTNQGIPFLKNVPLLGDLFGSQNNQRTRTELLVLITPHVVRSQQDAIDLTADLREQFPNAAAVPEALQTVPASTSDDPDAMLRARLPQ
jgi:general secretion pathway protein D